MSPTDIIISFTDTYLKGNLKFLCSFDLGSLRNDDVYGCPDRRFDPDDFVLMRAIYCVAFGEVWENLSMDNSGDGKLRGDTINSSATFFSYLWDDKFTPKWNPPMETSKILFIRSVI